MVSSLERSLDALEHLKLNLGLGNLQLTSRTVGDLLRLSDLVADGLFESRDC